MINYIISTDSACDLTDKLVNKYNIQIASMNFMVNGTEFTSTDPSFSTEQVCKFMKEGATTKTTQINEYEAEEYLSNLLEQKKDILHFAFTSGMSGTCNNFKKAAQKLNLTHENKIYVIDSLCQSAGIGLLIHLTINQIEKENLSINQACMFAENLKLKIAHYCTVDDLKYLAKGGRISSVGALVGNILKIKPLLVLNNDGIIINSQKVISRKKTIHAIADRMVAHMNTNFKIAYINYADCLDDANLLAELVKQKTGIIPTILPLSPITTCHVGPGTLAVMFVANNRD